MSTRQASADVQAQNSADDVKREIQQMGEQAQERLSELGEAARQQAHEWERGLEARIREKPLNAVLVAAGLGILIGILWRR